MTGHQLIVVVVLVAMIGALLSRRVSPPLGVVGAALALYLAGVIDAETAFSGLANPAPLTVAALYVVAAGVDRSGALNPLVRPLLEGGGDRTVLGRLSTGVAAMSAVVANTPVIAVLIPSVRSWAQGRGVAPSKFLIPLSYAAILGGNLTLVGTSTNLVASGALAAAGEPELSFWEPARLGLPVAVLAIAAVVGLASTVLPARGGGGAADPAAVRPFVVTLTVDDGGPLDGATVADGGLRSLASTYLVGVERSGEVVTPVGPTHVVRGGDSLTFAGALSSTLDIDRRPGLTLAEHRHVWSLDDDQHAWFEVIIGPTSPLVGRTVKESGFRQRYQAAVVAISRSGEQVDAKLGDVRLRVGDALLVVADLGFRARWRDHGDFLFIHRRSEAAPTARAKAPLALAVLAGLVVLPVAGIADVVYAAIASAGAMVGLRVVTIEQARNAVGLGVVAMIAAALALGAAVTSTGLAEVIADGLAAVPVGGGAVGAAVVVVVATLVLTEVISNAGAAAVMVPVALSTAVEVGADPRQFALGVTLAAASSFLTPIGYQTNTMVYGPGHYRPTDYLRLGLPLTLIVTVAATVFMTLGW